MTETAKQFTVIDTETQQNKTFESHATTVAELKNELRQLGINIEGKTIQEGISRVEFKDDSSILPSNLPYRGTVTNNLVFRLTKTNKQVRSGAMSRPELYNYIKSHNLGDEVKKKFGRNFTQCGTNDLVAFVEKHMKKGAEAPKPCGAVPEPHVPAKPANNENKKNVSCDAVDVALINLLVNKGVITSEEANSVLKGETPKPEDKPKSYQELNDLFAGMN